MKITFALPCLNHCGFEWILTYIIKNTYWRALILTAIAFEVTPSKPFENIITFIKEKSIFWMDLNHEYTDIFIIDQLGCMKVWRTSAPASLYYSWKDDGVELNATKTTLPGSLLSMGLWSVVLPVSFSINSLIESITVSRDSTLVVNYKYFIKFIWVILLILLEQFKNNW